MRIQTKEQRMKQVISRLRNENKMLRIREKQKEVMIQEMTKEIETLKMQLNELQEIVFGKRKDKGDGNKDESDKTLGIFSKKKKRDKASYQRDLPKQEEITNNEEYEINSCPSCHSQLIYKEKVIRYIEDILIPLLERDLSAKKIIKQKIEKGYCPICKKWHAGKEIGKQKVTIGKNVNQFVIYSIYIMRLSYQQVQDILLDFYDFKISDGEIARILEKSSNKLNPEYERIKKKIRAGPVHMDETGWLTQGQRNYAWVMASGKTEEAVFLIGKNRGKGHALDLLGDNYTGVRITDFYGAYKNLPGDHQGCWAHIIRKVRDLKNYKDLPKIKQIFVKEIYEDLATLHEKLNNITKSKFVKKQRIELLPNLYQELDCIINKMLTNENLSPKKLIDLKNLLIKYKKQLFTCVNHKGVETTNNKAERKLRHLVIKRKNCFGTKTEKGNHVFAINFSVLMSFWWQDRKSFFAKISELL